MIRKNLLLTLLMALFVPLAALAQNAPTNLSVVLRPDDGTVAYLKWDPAGSETEWTLNYWTNPDWVYYSTKQVSNMPQQRLTGLTPGTTYYVRVKARNGSTYSETFSFTPKDFYQRGDVDKGQTDTDLPINTGTIGGFSMQTYTSISIPKGKINKISFYAHGNQTEPSRNIKVYMSEVDKVGSWNWCDPSYLVFSGTKAFGPGWNEIVLNTPYEHTGRHTYLCVWMIDETRGAQNALSFAVDSWIGNGYSTQEDIVTHFNIDEGLRIVGKGGGLFYDRFFLQSGGHPFLGNEYVVWENGVGYSVYGYELDKKGAANVIRLGYESLQGNSDVTAEVYWIYANVTGEGSATLRWEGKNAQHYVLQYSTNSSFPTNQTTTKYLYDNSFSLSGLSPTTTYYCRVKAIGAFNDSQWKTGLFKPSLQVAIGSGTATNFYLPFNSNYKYYLSQQIYTASEMTKAGIVESVTFECSTLSNPETRNLDIYMVHTDKTQFNSKSDWVPVTPDDLVFSGPVTFNNGLNRINFISGFEYDGQRNVVLVVDDNTGEYGATPNFAVFTTPNLNQSITYGNSFNNVDVQNTSGFSQYSVDLYSTKNRVTFNINTPSGMNKPTGLVATLNPDTPTEATLGWTENGTATRWDVRYGTDPSFADCQTMEVSDTPQAQLTGLTPETTYYAQVRSLQNSSSAWSAPIAFVPTDKIVVGAGEAINGLLPTFGIITTISQQIYTADELLNEPRLIESVSFYCENITFTRGSVGINLMHTDKEVFDNTDDMMSIDNGVTVFNGEVTFVAGEWTTINFTTPFAYDGTSNVALTVGDFSGSQSLGAFPNFKAFETGRNQAIVSYQDSGPMYTQLDTEKNQVRWGVSAVCEAIYHHPEQVGYSPGNSAAVWWFEMGEATEWTVQHGPNANFTEGSYTEQNVTGEPHIELKNLTPNSIGEYYVRVRSVCGEGFHSFWSDVITLRPEASNEICDGGGSSTDVLPTSPNYYNYYLSQQIYTRQELRSMPCAIGSVEFGWQNTAFPVRILDIYMVHTDKTQFDSKNDWVQVTADDLVFSGETTFGQSTITFNKRFMYDGTSNVVLVVNDKTGATDANLSELYYVFATENNQALYAGSNYGNIDPLGTLFAAEGLVNMKNCVTFGWEECPILKPTMHDPTLIPDDVTMVTLSWTENGAATEWVLQYGASDEFGYNFEELLGEITVTGTPTFNLTGLTPWTWYQARVKAIYREGDAEYHSDWSQTAMFMTEQKIDVGTEMQDWVMDLPTHIYYNYSYTQQIYTKDELLNKSGIIRSVDFMKTYDNTSRKLKVYMVHTDKEEFDNVNDWLTVTADNLVFDGYAYFQKDEWSTITFDTPFEYNGTSNVALVVYDETGESHNVGTKFKCFSGSKNRAIGMTSSSSIDPLSANPGNATVVNSFRNKVRFGWEEYPAIVVSPGHPYEFGFETYASGWTVPEGWDTDYEGGHESDHCAAHISNNREYLLSPEISFHESCDNVIIRFRAKGVIPNSSYSPICFVYSSDDDFTSPVNIGTLSVTSLSADTWKECVFSLCQFMSSGSVKIAFDPGLRTEYSIDNIEIVANAYDKVLDGKTGICFWEAGNFYPQGLPTYSDDVLVCSNAQINVNGEANNIEFGTNGTLSVRVNKTLSLNSALSKITANKANALRVSGTVYAGELVPQAKGSVVVYERGVIHASTITCNDAQNLVINDGQVYCNKYFRGTYRKNITGYGAENVNQSTGWHLIAPPASGSLFDMGLVPMNGEEYLFNQMDLYNFKQNAELEWHNFKQSDGTIPSAGYASNIYPMEGYLYARQDQGTLEFKSNSTFPATTTDQYCYDELYYYDDAAFAGWNLIGNPFTANAYLKDAEGNAGNAMAYYRMNAAGDRIELAELGTPIKPCEGVFVQVTDNGDDIAPVWFTTTQPQSGRGAMDFTVSKQSSTRDGASASATPIDRARISFNEGKGMGHLDLMADANRLYIPQSGKDMAVVCSEPAGEMPLNFEAAENGTYTLGISLNDTELVYCHLIDNLTGADVDLLATSTGSVAEYTFEAKTTDYRSRFKVVFVAKSAFEGDNANNFAFHNGSAWVINASADATVQVIDMTGRVVVSTDVARGVSTNGIAPGVYVMRLVDGNDVKTQKIVVD